MGDDEVDIVPAGTVELGPSQPDIEKYAAYLLDPEQAQREKLRDRGLIRCLILRAIWKKQVNRKREGFRGAQMGGGSLLHPMSTSKGEEGYGHDLCMF